MDIIRLDDSEYNQATIVNNIPNKLWVERFFDPGEFKFTAPAHSNIRTELPIGSLISHIGTKTVMIVQSHLIEENADGESTLIISGESLDCFLRARVAIPDGQNGTTNADTGEEYTYGFGSGYVGNTWEQAVVVLENDLLQDSLEPISNLEIPNLSVSFEGFGIETETTKTPKIGQLDKTIKELMSFCDGGIKVVRPTGSETTMAFVIYSGVDKSGEVVFDWINGDLKSARYFWSNKNKYNGFYVRGKYHTVIELPPVEFSGFSVQMLLIDASDIDGDPTEMTAPELTALEDALRARGYAEINQLKEQTLLDAVASQKSLMSFRDAYDVGDIVMVNGNYGVRTKMRVTEYAEIEDENGESGYPTLAKI